MAQTLALQPCSYKNTSLQGQGGWHLCPEVTTAARLKGPTRVCSLQSLSSGFIKIQALALKLGCPQVQLAGVNPARWIVAVQEFCFPELRSASLMNCLGPVFSQGSAFQSNSEPFFFSPSLLFPPLFFSPFLFFPFSSLWK